MARHVVDGGFGGDANARVARYFRIERSAKMPAKGPVWLRRKARPMGGTLRAFTAIERGRTV